MRRYSSYFGYTLADPRFYEDLGRFLPEGGDFERRVHERVGPDVTVSRRGPWVSCRPPGPDLPAHGWKIHVSAVPDNASQVLDLLLDEFTRDPFRFKCLRDRRLVVSATARWWQPGQVGKFIAIYPGSAQECREMLARLEPVFAGMKGPYILTDRRYRESGSLYYRYGGFTSQSRLEVDGTSSAVLRGPDGQEWDDDRSPLYRIPPWVPELVELPEPEPASREINGYLVLRALHHNGTGGVYLAERVSDGRTVVLKESRPRTAFALDGSSGQVRLAREWEALTALSGTGVAPEPLEMFEAWEHLFLAQEYIEHGSLAQFISARQPLTHGDLSDQARAKYQSECDTVITNLRAAVDICHKRGICYGDISLTNVMVEPETLAVRLIDFESSRPLAQWNGQTPSSPGFRPDQGSPTWQDPIAFDNFGVDSIELALVTSRNILRELEPTMLTRVVRNAARLLRRPLGDLLERVQLPTDVEDDPLDLDLAIKEAARFVEATMTPDRDDRLFPSGPEVFRTNPWSVAYGAAGVLRGLSRLTGGVPGAAEEWMDRQAAALDKLPPGLYHGLAGVGWAMLELGRTELGLELIDRAGAADPGGLPATVLDGVAGIGLAHLARWRSTGEQAGLNAAVRAGEHLIRTAVDSGFGLYWRQSGQKLQPLGYATGSSGVASFLLYLHLATGEQRYRTFARRALDFDFNQLAPRSGEGIGLPAHADRPLLEPYWERGSAGFGSVLARFCRVTGDERLLGTLNRLVNCTVQGTTVHPGLFSGMSGVANFALDCHHLLGGDSYRDLAAGVARSVLAMACRQPEGLAFPGYGLLRYSTEFAAGGIGIALVLDRLHRGGPDVFFHLDELMPHE